MHDALAADAGHRRRDTIVVATIIAIGAALRLLYLGAPSIWLDEALSIAYARMPWPQFTHLMATRELNMLPYYLLLRAWIHLGTQEWIVRSLSVICSIATLPLFYRLGARLFGERTGQIGVALLALNPYHVRFAQEARGYSLMLLLVTASTLLLVRAVDGGSHRRSLLWIGYVVTSVLAVYAHFYAGLAILAQWTALLVVSPRALSLRPLALSIAAICVLLLPVAAFVLLGHADPAGWIPHPSVKRVEFLIYSLLGGDNSPGARVYEYPVLVVAIFASAASVRTAWRANRRETQGWRYALVVCGAILPIVLVLAVSLIKPFFVDKYLVECLPFVVLLLAVGLDHVRPRALSLGATIYILALSAHALATYYRKSDKDDWRAATRYILASAKPEDGVVLFPHYESAPFDYYRASLDTTATAPAVADLAGGIPALQQHFSRVWSVYSPNGIADRDSPDSLSRRFPVLGDSQFVGIRVTLYDTRGALPDTATH
jgi:uncharacterized membrane protein